MEVRLLTADDAPAFQALRLRALQEHPEAFAASVEDAQQEPLAQVACQIRDGPPLQFTLGAFAAETLVGLTHLARYPGAKLRHKARIGGMYVAPEVRGQGIGAALLDAAIAQAAALGGIEALTLAVTVGNTAARGLYQAAGFVAFGVEPRFIRVDEHYYDIEWMIKSLALDRD
jgi:ribosomal protein S18 acetylase RimI-like enzyme